VTLAEAAHSLGLSHATLRWQIRNKKLRARKMGNLWTVTADEVERYRRESLGKR
jgi:excisionase family DNA binding protein